MNWTDVFLKGKFPGGNTKRDHWDGTSPVNFYSPQNDYGESGVTLHVYTTPNNRLLVVLHWSFLCRSAMVFFMSFCNGLFYVVLQWSFLCLQVYTTCWEMSGNGRLPDTMTALWTENYRNWCLWWREGHLSIAGRGTVTASYAQPRGNYVTKTA